MRLKSKYVTLQTMIQWSIPVFISTKSIPVT